MEVLLWCDQNRNIIQNFSQKVETGKSFNKTDEILKRKYMCKILIE